MSGFSLKLNGLTVEQAAFLQKSYPNAVSDLDPTTEADLQEKEDERAIRRLLANKNAEAAVRRQSAVRGIPKGRTLAERLAVPRRPKEWRIESLLQIGQRAVLAAQFKAGKTTLVMNVAKAFADNEPFLGQFEVSPPKGKVGLLDFEMAEEDRCQLDDWYESIRVQHPERIVVYPLRGAASTFNILDPVGLAEWAARFKEDGIEFPILDCGRPVLDALGLDENHDVGLFLTPYDALLVQAGCSGSLVIQHQGHENAKKPGASQRSRGDSRWRDWPDVEWFLNRPGDDPAGERFFKAYGRGVDQPLVNLLYDHRTHRVTTGLKTPSTIKDSDEQAKIKKAKTAILAALAKAPRSYNKTELRAFCRPITNELADRAVLELAQVGAVEETKGARGAFLYSQPANRLPLREVAA